MKYFLFALLAAASLVARATNEKNTVAQVSDEVKLDQSIDYVVTGTEPFATAGSVNIENREHAVLILAGVKPSAVLKNWMGHIRIGNEPAKDGENCQVKMYGRGTIVLPYDKDLRPLTCYDGQNFRGDACDDYAEGHSGGFMKNIDEAHLNNRIRSFKLKRGYMVTFAIGQGGWGYSRCFIADQEDLEVATLPGILDKRISSYRIFKWYNAHKAGIGDCNDAAITEGLNLSWCYRMWPDPQGFSKLPDTEYVPHHYKESYPDPAWLGQADFSCHMKTNNEPRNQADEEPTDLEHILANWQALMRTGMRLCSPSSWDGSDPWNVGTGFIKTFLDSIDARGWRCDIVDAHCYWPEGNFQHLEGQWYPKMKRPIWISEWVWGASWNNNGAFVQGVTEKDNAEAIKRICGWLNQAKCVERYAYWNSERDPSRLVRNDGKVTETGEFYATMDVGQGYDASMQFIPTGTRIEPLGKITIKHDRNKGTATLTWEDPNWDALNDISVQCMAPGTSRYATLGHVVPKDKNSAGNASYTYTTETSEPGAYKFRIRATAYNGNTLNSEEATLDVNPSQGTQLYQYGTATITSTEKEATINFTEELEVEQSTSTCIFVGSMTNKNATFRGGNITANNFSKTYFSYKPIPWTSNSGTFSENEELPFLALPAGNYTWGDLACEVGTVRSQIAGENNWTEVTEVVFNQAFPEGVTPVVLCEIRKPTTTSTAYCPKIFDVNEKGFKCIIYPDDETKNKVSRAQTLCYLAITPGLGLMDKENNVMIAAGQGTDNDIYGPSLQENAMRVSLRKADNTTSTEALRLYKPVILTALQTNNYPTACMLRRTNTTELYDETTWTTGIKIKRIASHAIEANGISVSPITSDEAYRDRVGWVAIAKHHEGGSAPTAIASIHDGQGNFSAHVVNGRVVVDGVKNFRLYNAAGAQIDSNSTLRSGIYIAESNGQTIKLLVK